MRSVGFTSSQNETVGSLPSWGPLMICLTASAGSESGVLGDAYLQFDIHSIAIAESTEYRILSD